MASGGIEKKSWVSALQEYCAQGKIDSPVYEYIDDETSGYVCKVLVMDLEAFGNGRSKRDAKHLAACNLLRKISRNDGDNAGESINSNSVVDELTNMNRDMLKELRDYCVSHDMPLPVIEIIQQSGSPDAPEFIACCSVASIKRYGKSDKKKDARQRAAIEMLCVISMDAQLSNSDELVSNTPNSSNVENTLEDVESERRRKFKTYRELTEGTNGEVNESVKLCDRHNYFKNFYPHLKESALAILRSCEYTSDQSQLTDVLHALKLTPRLTTVKSTSMEPLIQMELNSELECVFIGLESKIHGQVLSYFREMLI